MSAPKAKIKNIRFVYFYLLCVSVLHAYGQCPLSQKGAPYHPENEVTDCCKLPRGCGVLTSGLLQVRPVILFPGPSLQPNEREF